MKSLSFLFLNLAFAWKKDCDYYIEHEDIDNILQYCNDEAKLCRQDILGQTLFHKAAMKCNLDIVNVLNELFPFPSCSGKRTWLNRVTADEIAQQNCKDFPFFKTEFRFLQDNADFKLDQYTLRDSPRALSNIDAIEPINMPLIAKNDGKLVNLVNVGKNKWLLGTIFYQKVLDKLHIHITGLSFARVIGSWSICSSTGCKHCTKSKFIICDWRHEKNAFIQYHHNMEVYYLAKIPFTFMEANPNVPVAVKFDVASIDRREQQSCQLPRFHYTSPYGSMNDPSPVQIDGVYHLFFQHRYDGKEIIGWGHAKSNDLIHWEDMPTALKPDEAEKDALHLFAGTVVPRGYEGYPTIFYTSAHQSIIHYLAPYTNGSEKQNMAVSYDNGVTWVKKGMLISGPRSKVTAFRDPFVFQNKKFDELFAKSKCSTIDKNIDWWYMTVASGIRYKGGQILLYRSKSIENPDWQVLDLPLWQFNAKTKFDQVSNFGWNWEVANVFTMKYDGKEHFVLTFNIEGAISHFEHHQTVWVTGEIFSNSEKCAVSFKPLTAGYFDYGSPYAVNTFYDSVNDKRIAFAYIVDDGGFAKQRGSQIIPRELELASELIEGEERIFIAMKPASQFIEFYQSSESIDVISPGITYIGNSAVFEMNATVNFENEFFELFSLYADEYQKNILVQVTFNPVSGKLRVDRRQKSFYNRYPNHYYKTSRRDSEVIIEGITSKSESINLVVIIDHSVIEIFANDQTVITFREYSGSCNGHYMQSSFDDTQLKIWSPISSIWQ